MPDDLEYDVLPSHSAKDGTVVGSSWAPRESHTFRFRDPWKKQRCFIPVRLRGILVKGPPVPVPYIYGHPADREQEYPELLEACRTAVLTRPKCAMTKCVRLVAARGVKSEFPLVGPKT